MAGLSKPASQCMVSSTPPQPDIAHIPLEAVPHSIAVTAKLLVRVHKSLKWMKRHAELLGPKAICLQLEKAWLRDPARGCQRELGGPEQCWLRASGFTQLMCTHNEHTAVISSELAQAHCARVHTFAEQLYSMCAIADICASTVKAARHLEKQLT